MNSGTSFEVLWHAMVRARRDHITLIAAGVAFFMLLAIFPGLGAALSVYSLFADPGQGGPLLSALPAVLPDQVTQFIAGQIKQIAKRQQDTQSPFDLATILGFGLLLWSANRGMRSIFTALNTIGDTTEGRGIIKLIAISLLFTLAFLLFSVCAAGLILRFAFCPQCHRSGRCLRGLVAPPSLAVPSIGCWAIAGGNLSLRRNAGLRQLARHCPRKHRRSIPVADRVDHFRVGVHDLRQLRPVLWLAQRRDRVHDLGLDFCDRRSFRRRDQRCRLPQHFAAGQNITGRKMTNRHQTHELIIGRSI